MNLSGRWAAAAFVLAFLNGTGAAQQIEMNQEQPNNIYFGAGRLSGAYGFYSYDFGKLVLGATFLENRAERAREYQLGLGLDLDRGSYGFWPFLGVSKAGSNWYAQPWIYSWYDKGRFIAYGYFGSYLPVRPGGAFQLFIDSATALFKLKPWLGAGAAYSLGYSAGLPTEHLLGPAIQLEIWDLTTTVEYLRGVRAYGNEVRVTFQTSF
jgi:hypothetical protein